MSEAAALSALLALEEYARQAASITQLGFVMVNDSRALTAYRQAALFLPTKGVVAVSAVSTLEAGAPYTLWLERACRALWERVAASPGPLAAGAEALPAREAAEWADWLPEHALWVPLRDAARRPLGLLLFSRDEPWDEASVVLLARAADTYGFAWAALDRPGVLRRGLTALRRLPGWRWLLALPLLAALAIPVRLSVLAPAEVVAQTPAVIRAPMDGVIDSVTVQPNQSVEAGQVLVLLDRTTLAGRLEVAARAEASARAEIDQATQMAFFDPKAKAQVAVLHARAAEKAAEVAQLQDLMQRAVVRAPRAGVAVVDDPSEWIGRPVSVGERILLVADPADVAVEAMLAPADLIALDPGAAVTLFLNTDPLNPVAARLSYITYQPVTQPDGQLAYRARATLTREADAAPPPRLGLKGTARLDGARVPLVYWLFRRPWAVVRQHLGW